MFLLATVEHEFSVFDFSNNLINWLVLVGLIVWLCSKTLPGVFANRRQSIESTLSEAARARVEGQAFLAEQETKLANAEHEADKILVEARQMAEDMKKEVESQTQKDIAEVQKRLEQDITNQRQQAIMQLRSAATRAAIALTEMTLPAAMNDKTSSRLFSEFVDQLETNHG